LTSGSAAGDELAELYTRQAALSDNELARAAHLVELAGARTWSQSYADELLDDVLRELGAVGRVPVATAELSGLARLVTRRDH
jgi:geranylgeranyl diphosphate synthase, type I